MMWIGGDSSKHVARRARGTRVVLRNRDREEFGQGKNEVAVVDGKQNIIDQMGGGALDFALMAGRAKPTAFTGEGEQVFVPAIIAADPGEATLEAAVDEFFHDLLNHRAEWAVLGLIRVAVDKSGLVPLGALPEGRVTRIPGAIRTHDGRHEAAEGFYGGGGAGLPWSRE